MPLYWTMAQQYVLADKMFPSEFGGSYTAHMFAVAGNDDISNTTAEVNIPSHAPNDCDSPPQTKSSLVDVNRNVGRGNGPFPCFSQFDSLANVLDAAGLSWRYYIHRHLNGGIYSPFEALAYVRYGADWDADVIAPETRVLTDIPNGNLAAVTWITPKRNNSDLPGTRSDHGPSWVTAIVNEIGESQYWTSTAVVIIWDEWGGWFDNAPPPQRDFRGLGIRRAVPHHLALRQRGALRGRLRFAHEVRVRKHPKVRRGGLQPAADGPASQGYTDSRAASLANSFDFTQPPRRFTPFGSKYPASYFVHEPPSNAPVDDQ